MPMVEGFLHEFIVNPTILILRKDIISVRIQTRDRNNASYSNRADLMEKVNLLKITYLKRSAWMLRKSQD